MEQTPTKRTHTPHVPASENYPEITVKAVVLAVLLSIILGAANAYLGLFVGIVVSASIPAAVISMAVLRMFKTSNILENNIVQTAASAGEGLAAGVIFTIPAVVLLGVWTDFNYWETTIICGFGGVLGVLFTVPLRRALIVDDPLQFPEGVATAEVLKVGEAGGSGVGFLASAAIIGAIFKFVEASLRLWSGAVAYGRQIGGSIAFFGMNTSPALIAVGYIVGLNIAVLVFLGGAFNWWIAIPIVAKVQGIPEGMDAVSAAGAIWSSQTRYLGVGAMLVGGIWALIKLRKSLVSGIKSGLAAYREQKMGGAPSLERTEREIPMQWVGITVMGSAIPLYFIFEHFTQSFGLAAFMSVIMLIAGFLFSAVAGYMSGLVGSSNNPISGVTIATILCASLLLLLILGKGSPTGPAAAIFIGAVVCCAAAIAGDNLQDLKAGYLLGATPWKQQVMQIIGVVAAAFVMAPVLQLLLKAYGMGPQTAEYPRALAAPQASLMASVAQGVFGEGLPWLMISIGMAIAVAVIILDLILEKRESTFRTPVLAVAVGIYLPFGLEVPIFIGGVIAWLAGRAIDKRIVAAPEDAKEGLLETKIVGGRHGLLFAAGLITGEAIIGILAAIPIVIWKGDSEKLAFFGVHDYSVVALLTLLGVMFTLYKVASPDIEKKAA